LEDEEIAFGLLKIKKAKDSELFKKKGEEERLGRQKR